MFSKRFYILIIFSIASLVVLSSCGSTIKNHWRDFTAYYNTYYNAKRSFQTGLEKVEEQSVNINPEQPVRIHSAPVSAGQQDFEKAITKGAKILREYNKSKWVDDALRLIGKSYYYKQEYFSAEQKFRELYSNASDPSMKQEAVYWRARTFMEMELYSQALSYLQNELDDIKDWEPHLKAEVQAVAAESYSQLQQWELADQYLVKAIPELKDDDHKARAFFLHGQILERLERLEEAFGAYRKVPGLHPPYDLVYHAKRKQAEVSREAGNLERAYRIFVDMSKDDKNFEILPELKYEIARTLQAMGNSEEAITKYNRVLRGAKNDPSPATKAKTYYGLGNLYQQQYKDFRMAATYYDSASSVSVDKEKLPEDYQANELAKSFGEYASLKDQIHLADSLLWLGGLPKAKFDSVLAEIKERRRKKLEEMKKDRRRQANTVTQQGYGNQTQQEEKSGASGFLNYQNRRLVTEARQSFEAYWGNRPLVDHWRRLEMIRQLKQSTDTAITEEGTEAVASGQQLRELNINLQDIPFSKEAQQQKRREILKSKYELANTFFLSLNMPDSARHYYNIILEQAPDTASIIPQTLYSLSEMSYIENDTTGSRRLAEQLVKEYPKTEYARRVAERFNLVLPVESRKPTSGNPDSAYTAYQELVDSLTTVHSLARARAFTNFEHTYQGTRAGGYALYLVAGQYLQVAKLGTGSRRQYRLRQLQGLFTDKTTASQPIASLSESGGIIRGDDYPCSGRYWDSVRTTVSRLHQNYSGLTVQSAIHLSSEADSLYSCRDVQLETKMNESFRDYVDRLENAEPYENSLDSAGNAFVELRDRLYRTLTQWEAENKRAFALSHAQSRIAPYALHNAARLYMELGRRDSTYQNRANKWFEAVQRMEEARRKLQQEKDSISVLLHGEEASKTQAPAKETGPAPERPDEVGQEGPPEKPQNRQNPPRRDPRNQQRDEEPEAENPPRQRDTRQDAANKTDTTENQLSKEKRTALQKKLKSLQDSTIAEPDYKTIFPYLGTKWDSARVILDQFAANFQGDILRDQVQSLKGELALPEELTKTEEDSVAEDSLQQNAADSLKKAIPDSARKMATDSLEKAIPDSVRKMAADSLAKQKKLADKEPQKPSEAAENTGADTARVPQKKQAEGEGPPGRQAPPKEPPTTKQPPREPPKDSATVAALMDTTSDRQKAKVSSQKENEGQKQQKKYPTCELLNAVPEVKGGMEAFTKTIKYPDKVKNMSMDGQATFDIIFDEEGRPKNVEPLYHGTLGIQDAVKEAIEKHLVIKPIKHEGKPVAAQCEMSIPIHIEPSKNLDAGKDEESGGDTEESVIDSLRKAVLDSTDTDTTNSRDF